MAHYNPSYRRQSVVSLAFEMQAERHLSSPCLTDSDPRKICAVKGSLCLALHLNVQA